MNIGFVLSQLGPQGSAMTANFDEMAADSNPVLNHIRHDAQGSIPDGVFYITLADNDFIDFAFI